MTIRGGMITLRNWSTCGGSRDPYMPPELNPIALQGNVYGHPAHADGDHVVTSLVMQVAGRVITTKSGSVYRLGCIDPKFRRWLREQGRVYDPREPIKDLREKGKGRP